MLMDCSRAESPGHIQIISPSEMFFGCRVRTPFLTLGSNELDLAISALAREIQRRNMRKKSQSGRVELCPPTARDLVWIQSLKTR
jgi:hypothetical protein